MRIATIMSVAILGLSTAALAQVSTSEPGQSTDNNIVAANEAAPVDSSAADSAATTNTTQDQGTDPAANASEPK
jgi:hypothetical protein